MDDARALLNSLMGADRDARPEQRRVRKFTDEGICRHYLLGLCPHDLFTNTKIDLGACSKEHNDMLKETFEQDTDAPKLRRKWRGSLRVQLKGLLDAVDRRISQNQLRVAREKEGGSGVTEEQKRHIAALKEEVSEKLKQAEKAADDGRFEDSRNTMKDVDGLKRKIEDVELKRYEKYRKENVCDICGLIIDAQEAEDMKTGRGWHSNGKQHIGYTLIRQKLKEIEEEQALDRKNGVPSPSPSPSSKAVPATGSAAADSKRKRASPSRSAARQKRESRQKRSRSKSRARRRPSRSRSAKKPRKADPPRRRSPSRSKRRSPSRRRSKTRSRSRKKRSRSGDRSRRRSPSREKRKEKRPSRSSDSDRDKRAKKSSTAKKRAKSEDADRGEKKGSKEAKSTPSEAQQSASAPAAAREKEAVQVGADAPKGKESMPQEAEASTKPQAVIEQLTDEEAADGDAEDLGPRPRVVFNLFGRIRL